MKTMPRLSFIVTANIVWLGQFAAVIVMVLLPDYVEWWQREAPNLQLGCFEDSARYDPLDRAFVFGLLWLVSTPLMNIIAARFPERWPARLTCFWWNPAASPLSLATGALALAIMSWPLAGALNAPVTSSLILEGVRGVLLSGVALYYRAIMLSAADTHSRSSRENLPG